MPGDLKAERRGIDRVVLVPSAIPPHKAAYRDMASAEARIAMCRRAIADNRQFEVDDIELQRPGPSYTIDTVRQLTARAAGPIYWLIGADTLPQLPTWHEPAALLREVNFVIMARPGWHIDWASLSTPYQSFRQNVVEVAQIDISATDIRARVAAGLPIDYLTPPEVVRFIKEHALYRAAGPQ